MGDGGDLVVAMGVTLVLVMSLVLILAEDLSKDLTHAEAARDAEGDSR